MSPTQHHETSTIADVDVRHGAPHDVRLAQLAKWLQTLFGANDFVLTTASADASFRRYFRVTRAGETWIAMDAPPDKENMKPYIRIAGLLVDAGVNAPRVMHSNFDDGYLLNSDLGSTTYLAALTPENADKLYRAAIGALVTMQSRGIEQSRALPAYDAPLLQREMTLFPEWFCGRHLGLELDDAAAQSLQGVCDALATEALGQPRVFVHRDYHSRNLMLTEGTKHGANPGILDFQDAVYGPVTYDLVSLLRDCYIAWPAERVQTWLRQYREIAAQVGIGVGADEAQFVRWFDWMGVQRHLKAIGIFARLWHRDGKSGYLKDIPRTLEYVREVAGRYPELAPLRQLIDAEVLAILPQSTATALQS